MKKSALLLGALARANELISVFPFCLAGMVLLFPSAYADPGDVLLPNKLPAIAETALSAPESVVLYSLEPYTENPDDYKHWKGATFHGYMCLGKVSLRGKAAQTAISEFRNAVPKQEQPMADCFDPRHVLSIAYKRHTYDFLLCFQCQQMQVCEDGKELAVVSATGSADVLNGILKKAGIPLSFIFSDTYIKKEKSEQEKSDADWKRWLAAAPKSLTPFLTNAASAGITFGNDPEKELAKEIPEPRGRIMALLSWYGSGGGPWSGFTSYEQQPEELLMRYSTADILSAIQSTSLTEAQLEGAARFFWGLGFFPTAPARSKAATARSESETPRSCASWQGSR
jgi:hypothetical protein